MSSIKSPEVVVSINGPTLLSMNYAHKDSMLRESLMNTTNGSDAGLVRKKINVSKNRPKTTLRA